MSNTSSSGTSTRQTISGHGQLLLAGLLALAVAATALTLYVMAAKPAAPAAGNNADQAAAMAGPAVRVDQLSFEREQKERDEAAFAATWAEYSAPKQAAVTSDAATYDALRDQRMAEWTEIYVTQLEAQRPAAPAGAMSPKAVKVVAGMGCGADCVVSTWPDGTTVTSDLTSLVDYAALCACPILMQPR